MRYLFLSVVLGLVVCGCGGSRDDAAGGDGGKLIGATLITQTHVFYQDMVAAMQEEAVKNNFRLSIRYAENDGAAQNNHIGTFITQGVDAIILAPCDSDAIAPAVEEATRAGIPVFTADIAAHNAPVVCHVASDNVQGGRLIGEYLAKLLDNQGKVAIVDYPEVASVQDRVAGFEEVMNAHEGLTVVQKISGQGQRDRAHKATQDLLQSRQDIDAIFGINDDSALGALAAVEAAGLQGQIVIVGYDGTPEARDAISRGTALKADTVQHPTIIGRTVVEIIAKHFMGEGVPAEVPVEVSVIDAESLKTE